MAFTGTAVVKQISDREVRITGVSLAQAASGTIVLHGAVSPPAGSVTLPSSFQPAPYAYGTDTALVSLQDALSIDVRPAATNITVAVPLAVVKTGTTPADFVATLTNPGAVGASAALEIYVRFHD
jgi:hypothetical protein